MAEGDFILAPATVKVTVELLPVHSALKSLAMLTGVDDFVGLDPWLVNTAAALTPEQRHTHLLLNKALFGVFYPEKSWDSFPVYLNALANMDAEELRDRAVFDLLDDVRCYHPRLVEQGLPEAQELLADADVYINFIEAAWAEHDKELPASMRSLLREAHDLLIKPEALKERTVSHLYTMWDTYLAEEWERRLPMLKATVEAYRNVDLSNLTVYEAIRIVTGRDMRGTWEEILLHVDTLQFVPSPHLGPYVSLHSLSNHPNMAQIVYGARMPEGVPTTSAELSRSELLMRFNALADDTRLRMLELLTQHEELCAQDIMTMLDLSQSATSRHLRLLSATGYLTERRREIAKCYTLNEERLDQTYAALKRFLKL